MDVKKTDFTGVAEAMEITGYTRSNIAYMCRHKKMKGAKKVANRWLIPRASVENYVPGPRGFAAHPENNPGRGKKKKKVEDNPRPFRVDLTGKTFGKWKVLRFVEKRKRTCYWLCRCQCGTEKLVSGATLIRGTSKSCGCSRRLKK